MNRSLPLLHVLLLAGLLLGGCSGGAQSFVQTTASSASGNGGGGGGAGDCSGGEMTANLANSTGNAIDEDLVTTKVQGTTAELTIPDLGSGTTFTVLGTLCPLQVTENQIVNRVVTFTATDTTASLQPGTFAIGFDEETNTDHTLAYNESVVDLSTGNAVERRWTATAGTITVVSVDGDTAEFTATGTMTPAEVNGQTLATGTFDLEVTVRVDAMQRIVGR